jgi:hypothetical protein
VIGRGKWEVAPHPSSNPGFQGVEGGRGGPPAGEPPTITLVVLSRTLEQGTQTVTFVLGGAASLQYLPNAARRDSCVTVKL